MHRHRSLIFGLIAVVAGIVVMLTKPLTISTVGWTAFWAAVAVVVVTLVERPGAAPPPLNRSRRAPSTPDQVAH